jgi:hypothetical protein
MTAYTFTEMVHRIFREQTTAFKINMPFGFFLRHMGTGEARRAGDADPEKKIVAEIRKLDGNSSYGKQSPTKRYTHTSFTVKSIKSAAILSTVPFVAVTS